MIVHVTREHIDAGIRCDCVYCPIALALSDVISPEIRSYVAGRVVELTHPSWHRQRVLTLPYAAAKFIYRFDAARTVEPFSFEIDIPPECLK